MAEEAKKVLPPNGGYPMHTYEDLKGIFYPYIKNPADRQMIEKAYLFAAEKHKDQKRRSGEPYIQHPIEVAYILATLQAGPATLGSGFLHDVVEDTDTTIEEIEKLFGEDVAKIVDSLTKIQRLKLSKRTEVDFEAEDHRKIFLGMAKDVRVILVKLADRLHNLRTLASLNPDRQKALSKETLEVFTPIAHRLGINTIQSEMEDLCLKYLEPEKYQRILDLVNERTTRAAHNFGKDPAETIGSGPYYVEEWVPNDHLILKYNPYYWGEEPTIKEVFRRIIPDASTRDLMYQNGEVDLIDLTEIDALIVQRAYKVEHADKIVSAQMLGMTYLALNETNQYLKDVRVRKAIAMGIDTRDLIHNLKYDDAIEQKGIIPTGIWGNNPDLEGIAYDPEGARALLAEAGYQDGDVSFTLALSSSGDQLLNETVSNQLAKIGVQANIKVLDSATWMEKRLAGEHDAFIATWMLDYNDPDNIMGAFFGSPQRTRGRSICYPDTEVMARVSAARSIVDDEERKREYQELEHKIVVEDRAWIPLFQGARIFCRGERVESFTPFWAGYGDYYLTDVTLTKEARG